MPGEQILDFRSKLRFGQNRYIAPGLPELFGSGIQTLQLGNQGFEVSVMGDFAGRPAQQCRQLTLLPAPQYFRVIGVGLFHRGHDITDLRMSIAQNRRPDDMFDLRCLRQSRVRRT